MIIAILTLRGSATVAATLARHLLKITHVWQHWQQLQPQSQSQRCHPEIRTKVACAFWGVH